MLRAINAIISKRVTVTRGGPEAAGWAGRSARSPPGSGPRSPRPPRTTHRWDLNGIGPVARERLHDPKLFDTIYFELLHLFAASDTQLNQWATPLPASSPLRPISLLRLSLLRFIQIIPAKTF